MTAQIITLSDYRPTAAAASRAAQLVQLTMADRVEVGVTRNGVHIMEERFTSQGRELLLVGDGVRQWMPETMFIQQAEHVA